MNKSRLWLTGVLALSLLSGASAKLSPVVAQSQAAKIQSLKLAAPGIRFLMSGDRVSRVYGVPFAFGHSAIESAETFMQSYADVLSGGAAGFSFTGAQDVMNGKFTAIYFKQQLNGVPVFGSNVTLLVRNEPGNPVVLAVNGSLTVEKVGTTPSVRTLESVRSARGFSPYFVSFTEPSLTIYQGETSTHLAWTYVADNGSLSWPIREQVFVDAHTGQVLDRQSLICYVDMAGTVKGYATPNQLPDQANNPAVLTNLYGAKVTITAGATAYADVNGAFTITNGGSAAVTVNSTLAGQWARVINNSGATMSFSGSYTPPGPADFLYNPVPAVQQTSQVNGLIQTTAVHDFVRSISLTYPGVDIQMPVNVNVAGQANAFYDGSSINFYNAGGQYPNMCYTTVVWHEYGHHIVQSAGTAQNGYGEGMGDVTSSLLGDTNNLGMDFYGPGTGPLRNCYNSVTYPSGAEIHTQGQILSGAFWLTLDQLKATVGAATGKTVIRSLWLNSILLRPSGISPGITVDVLTLDDTDGYIGNGTPHYNQVKNGFNPKGLTAPSLDALTIVPENAPTGIVPLLPVVTSDPSKIAIVASVSNFSQVLDTSSVRLKYAVGTGTFNTAVMSLIGGSRFQALIPRPRWGQSLRYYIEASSTQPTTQRYPIAAPVDTLQFVMGTGKATQFSDTFESNLGWTVTNDASLTTGAWVRANPNGSSDTGSGLANPEDDSDDVGTLCYFTGQAAVGAGYGTTDVDGGPTRLTSPVFSLAGSNGILEYSRWFFCTTAEDSVTVELSNDGGATWVPVDSDFAPKHNAAWIRKSFIIGNYVVPTANMKMRITTSDNPNNSVTEAGLDNVIISRVTTPLAAPDPLEP